LFGERAFYFLLTAVENLRSNWLAVALSILYATLCLILIGVVFVLSQGFAQSTPAWMLDPETKAVVYLHTDISQQQQDRLVRELERWPEIGNIRLVSKEEAWKQLQSKLNNWKDILQGIPDNPLPASIEVTFKSDGKNAGDRESALNRISMLPEVEEICSGEALVGRIKPFFNFLRLVGLGVLAFSAIVLILVISNAVSHSLFSRGNELEIYKIVGATRFFIETPFYIEGTLQGLAGTAIAGGALLVSACFFQELLPGPIAGAFSWEARDAILLLLWLSGWGIGLSCLGSWLALKRFLFNAQGSL
jgi:cell division transport system permease protein